MVKMLKRNIFIPAVKTENSLCSSNTRLLEERLTQNAFRFTIHTIQGQNAPKVDRIVHANNDIARITSLSCGIEVYVLPELVLRIYADL